MPKRSLIYLSVCLTGVIIYVSALIMPLMRSIETHRHQVDDLRNMLEIQKLGLPLYRDMKIKADIRQQDKLLPLPEVSSLPRAEIDQLSSRLTSMAKKNGLVTIKVDPDLANLSQERGTITVSMEIQGEFLDFRNYMISLTGLPYFKRFDEIQLKQTQRGLIYHLKFDVLIG